MSNCGTKKPAPSAACGTDAPQGNGFTANGYESRAGGQEAVTQQNYFRRVARHCILLLLATCAAYGSPIQYVFTATTRATLGSPAHTETFELIMPDFLPVTTNGGVISLLSNDPSVISCSPCKAPPVAALHFLRGGSGDSIQFQDTDNVGRFYLFAPGALTTLGPQSTLPGINVNMGTLVVSRAADETSAPEPSTWTMIFGGLTAAAIIRRRRRGGRDERNIEYPQNTAVRS